MPNPKAASSIWTAGIVAGLILLLVGIGAFYVDEVNHSAYDFFDRIVANLLFAILIGTVLTFVAVICWARQFGRRTRLRTAGIVFAVPWVGVLIGYRIDGMNVHGASGFIMLIVPIAMILAFVLVIMAVGAGSKT
jgi:hypothetical protein